MALSLRKKLIPSPKLVTPEISSILKKPVPLPGDTIVGIDRKMTNRLKFPIIEILMIVIIIAAGVVLYNRFKYKKLDKQQGPVDLLIDYCTGRRENYDIHLNNIERDFADMSQNIDPRLKRPNRTADLTYYNRY